MTTTVKTDPNTEKNITKKSKKGGGQIKNGALQFICSGKVKDTTTNKLIDCKESLQFGKNIEYTPVYLPDKTMVIRVTCKKCGQKYEIYNDSEGLTPVTEFKKTWDELTNIEKAELKAVRIRENAVKKAEEAKIRMENFVKIREELANRIVEAAIAKDAQQKILVAKNTEIKEKVDKELVVKADVKRTKKNEKRLALANKTIPRKEKETETAVVKKKYVNKKKQKSADFFNDADKAKPPRRPIIKANSKEEKLAKRKEEKQKRMAAFKESSIIPGNSAAKKHKTWQEKAEMKAATKAERLIKDSAQKTKQKKMKEDNLKQFLASEKRRKEKKLNHYATYLTEGAIPVVKTKKIAAVRPLCNIAKTELCFYDITAYKKIDGKEIEVLIEGISKNFATTLGDAQTSTKDMFEYIIKCDPEITKVNFYQKMRGKNKWESQRDKVAFGFNNSVKVKQKRELQNQKIAA